MVLPISGFLPVPLPMMIPFMGAQSLVIGKMFGEGFQYGKRKISAMPNEEFNKLTFEKMMSNARSEMQAAIPTMQQAMQDMKPMVETVVHEFTNYLSLVIAQAPQELGQVTQSIREATGFNKVNDMLVKLIADAKAGLEEQDLLKELKILQLAFAEDMPVDSPAPTPTVSLTSPSGIKVPVIQQAPFQGPAIIPSTGETQPFVKALQTLPPPASHIRDRSRSNVSLQSLRLENAGFIQKIKHLTNVIESDPSSGSVQAWFKRLTSMKQQYANFLKMHGSRL